MEDWESRLAESLANSEPDDTDVGRFHDGITVAWCVIGEIHRVLNHVNATPLAGCEPGTLWLHSHDWSPPGPVKLGFRRSTRPFNEGVPRDAKGQPLYSETDFAAVFSDSRPKTLI